VTGTRIVPPTAIEVTYPVPGKRRATPTERLLTLTTCHPRYSARQRMVVSAVLSAEQGKDAGPPAGVRVSVDTSRAAVAEAALEAGASIVNDVSGGLADPAMAKVVAAAGVPWVLMHWRGHSRDMQGLATYGDVVGDVRRELSRQVDAAALPSLDEVLAAQVDDLSLEESLRIGRASVDDPLW